MSIATPFIKRPVLTTVCTILIILLGTISILVLPLEKLPEIAPKRVSVTANYVGADAQTAVDNVTTILEREINGVEDAKWMDSNTTNTGTATINVSFPTEKDGDITQVQVQNRVGQAQTDLPSVVTNSGITTEKQSPSITLVYAFYPELDANGEPIYDEGFLFNYVDRFLWNDLRRIEGVGSMSLFGSEKYAMRIWLDPDLLAAQQLTSNDVVAVVNEQNFEIGTGGIGQQPAPTSQEFEIPLRASGRVQTVEEAESMIVKVAEDGTLIRIRDVGRVELGQENYFTSAILNGDLPAVALAVYQLPGTNALDTANAIKELLAKAEEEFPPGFKSVVAFDSTLFVNASVREAVLALIQSVVLVVLIIFVFLQDWRTTIIPAIAIPVALIGAMIGMAFFGFSLNQLTLFSCILAAGLVVDDGITVVESVTNKLGQGMRPLQASLDSMDELAGAIVATTLVLLAVFIPVSFFPGTTGIVYRQFALVIIFAILFSTFNALSFSPSMSAILLGPQKKIHGPLSILFGGFNTAFDRLRAGYRWMLEALTHVKLLVVVAFVGGLVATGYVYQSMPQGFIPAEDQGFFFLITEGPPGASLNYTEGLQRQAMEEVVQFEEVEQALGLTGFSFDGQASNKGIFFVQMKPWDERPGDQKSVYGVLRRLNQRLAQKISGGRVVAVNAPAVDGLGSVDGLEMYVQDRALKGMEPLIANTQRVLQAANERPEIGVAFTTFTFSSPILEADIDRDRAKAQNVDINEIISTLQTYLGSNYINQFVLDGRAYRVLAQADGDLRTQLDDINRLYVRSRDGNLAQLSSFITLEETTYPPIVTNYNAFPAIKLNVSPAPGFSTGQAIQAMEEVSNQVLQPGFGYDWTNSAAEEKAAGGAAPIVFGLAFVMAFLVLAAQYESYVDPAIIMLTVPLAILGAIGGIWLRASLIQGADSIWPVLNNNIYVQVGLVMLIGLASKNAILIVEFANQARELGMDITRAAVYAAEQRFRPILMTAISTIVGFTPLLIATGAGSVSRWSLGTAVFGGMCVATVLSLVVVPNLYIVIKTLEDNFLTGSPPPHKKPKKPQTPPPSDGGGGEAAALEPEPSAAVQGSAESPRPS